MNTRSSLILFSILIFGLGFTSNKALVSAPRVVTEQKVKELAVSCKPASIPAEKGVFGLSTPYLDNNLFNALTDLGVKWIRIDINWAMIEGKKNTYDWSYHDSLIAEAQKRGIRIEATINFIPPWITNWDDFYKEYAEFVGMVVARYKPQGSLARSQNWRDYGISYWEVFNEPNLPGVGWLEWKSDPSASINEYALSLVAANVVIRKEDPKAHILLGGVSTHLPSGEYLAKLYTLGIHDCFDIVAFHPYDYSGHFKEVREAIVKIIAPYGDQKKAIWFNEFGTDQADQQVNVLNKSLAEKDAAEGFFWYTLYDPPKGGPMSLVNRNQSKNPAYSVLKKYLAP